MANDHIYDMILIVIDYGFRVKWQKKKYWLYGS